MTMPSTISSPAVIDRLRAQKAEHLDKLFDEGEGYGGDFCVNAEYEALQFAATVIAEDCDPVQKAFEEGNPLCDYFNGLLDTDGNRVFVNLDPEETDAFLRGWCYTVRKFWEETTPMLAGRLSSLAAQ